MAWRAPAHLPVPSQFQSAIHAAMSAGALQHQDELTALLAWTQTLTPPVAFDIIVEIGTHTGGTLAGWATLAREAVFAIDLPNEWAGLAPAAAAERDQRFQQRYPHLTCLTGNSHDPAVAAQLATALAGRQVDFLFIDGDHSRWGVEDDYHRYRPFLRPGGIIAMHDANDSVRNRSQGIGVSEFFATLPEPKQLFTIGADWGGIGAIVVN